MKKQILISILLLFTVLLSINAISANEMNITDSDICAGQSKISNQIDDTSSTKISQRNNEILETKYDTKAISSDINKDTITTSENNASKLSTTNDDASPIIDSSKTITSKDITKYYKGSKKYSAKFLDKYGNVLSNKKVKITIKGVTYTKITNSNGVVSLNINLKPGNYKVIAQNLDTGYSLTTNFNILSTISSNTVKKVYKDNRKFCASFYKSNGKFLAKKIIKFKIKGKIYKVKTNSKGVASLSLKTLKKGTYKIVSYNIDGLTKTDKIIVYKKVSTRFVTSYYTFLKSDSKTVKVKLLNSLGYSPGSGKLIKITINGKTYSKKTNSKGLVSFKLPSLKNGVYTIKYKFKGDSSNKASNASDKVAIIPTKNPTLTVKSQTSFNYGSKVTFKLAVTSGSVPLAKKTVTFTINGQKYRKTTDNKGIVSLQLNLNAGKYIISYTVSKTSKTNAKTGFTEITINKRNSHNAYWLRGADMQNVDLNTLSSEGVSDIFLNYYAYTQWGKSSVESWISSAKNVGINVHIWVQSFYNDRKWINPVKNGTIDTDYFNEKINEILEYVNTTGIAGIHLDYLRYPGTAYKTSGGTEAITEFAKQAISAIKSVNSNLIVSTAVMPETTSNAYYYGQDYSELSKYFDVIVPMVYKGNYKKDSTWITKITKWFVDNSNGAKVWTGLQTYNNDEDTTKLSVSELTNDINAALSGGSAGVVLFRYGVSNLIDFNSI